MTTASTARGTRTTHRGRAATRPTRPAGKADGRDAATKARERTERIEALNHQLGDSVTRLADDEQWKAMLRYAARFHHYSANNVLLLWMQAEERNMNLSTVAGYRRWQSLGRQVRKGERGLQILAPMRRRLTEEEAAQRGPRGYDATGRPAMVVRGFGTEHVFDVSQTEGDPLPEPPAAPLLNGAAPAGLWDTLTAHLATLGYALRRDAVPGSPDANGSTHFGERVVRVHPDLGDAHACKTLIHELGHIHAGHDTRTDTSRAQGETEAESVAYIVGQLHGLDSLTYSTPYVAGWSDANPDVLRAAAEHVHRAAAAILTALDPGEHHQEHNDSGTDPT